jgi:hypothetical protein
MGLFSSLLHVCDTPRESFVPALDGILRESGFSRTAALSVPPDGPSALLDHDAATAAGPYFLASPPHGRWLTVIEANFALPDNLQLAALGNRLSAALSCCTLTLVVHDDDLFFYNLDHCGESLDGYNSCPQYFELARLSDPRIAEHRHHPEPFQALLPEGFSLDELRALLNRGWWNGYDAGTLDEDGVTTDDDGFVFEGERMTAFGTFLQLHGSQGEYPYAAWRGSKAIRWADFIALSYSERT